MAEHLTRCKNVWQDFVIFIILKSHSAMIGIAHQLPLSIKSDECQCNELSFPTQIMDAIALLKHCMSTLPTIEMFRL